MTRDEVIALMNSDLSREYSHWHFYMNAAIRVKGLHREELQEFFLKEAAGEMQHVKEFGCAILGMGGTPTVEVADFFAAVNVDSVLLTCAMNMEKEVVENYAKRMTMFGLLADQIELRSGEVPPITLADATFLEAFYEGQLLDSRNAVDHLTQML